MDRRGSAAKVPFPHFTWMFIFTIWLPAVFLMRPEYSPRTLPDWNGELSLKGYSIIAEMSRFI